LLAGYGTKTMRIFGQIAGELLTQCGTNWTGSPRSLAQPDSGIVSPQQVQYLLEGPQYGQEILAEHKARDLQKSYPPAPAMILRFRGSTHFFMNIHHQNTYYD
jgi:hypothetical protein